MFALPEGEEAMTPQEKAREVAEQIHSRMVDREPVDRQMLIGLYDDANELIAQALQEYADARLEEAAKVAEEYWKTGKNVYARHAGRAVEARIRKLKGAT